MSDEATTATKNPNEEIITLDTPIPRGAQKIDSVTLRKPLSGALRGCSLAELLQMDVNALRKVLPRVTTPALTEHEVSALDPADLVQMATVVAGFLLPKAAKAEASPDA
jgi:hypothetical protein